MRTSKNFSPQQFVKMLVKKFVYVILLFYFRVKLIYIILGA